MNTTEKTYLGDSVYASFDGHHIILTTENGLLSDPSNTIALDPSVRRALVDYERQLFEQPQEQRAVDAEINPKLQEHVMFAKQYASSHEAALKEKGVAYTAILKSLADIELHSVSMDTVDLNVCITGTKRDLTTLWSRLRKLGFRAPDNRPAVNAPEWSGRFLRNDALSIYVRFSSTVCRRVSTGRKIEIDEFEVVCDDDSSAEVAPDDEANIATKETGTAA